MPGEKVENWVNAVVAVQYHESVRKLSRSALLGGAKSTPVTQINILVISEPEFVNV
jgi:hypothetical protein